MKCLISTLVVATLSTASCGGRSASELDAKVVGHSAIASDTAASNQESEVEYVVSPDTSVVLNRDATSMLRWCSGGLPADLDGYWQPTRADLLALESGLPQRLAKDISRHDVPTGVRRIRVYRYYVGMFRAGTKVIYISGMPSDVVDLYRDDWRQGGAQGCGGGTLVFGLVYTPSTAKFDSFEGNGDL